MDNLNHSDLLSRAITLSRFPMITGIVALHCQDLTSVAELPEAAETFINTGSGIVCRIFVPLFFAVSGFLFFYNKDAVARGFYAEQWRQRVHTLLVPYLLWNLIAYIFMYIKTLPCMAEVFPRMVGQNLLSLPRFIASFWSFSCGPGGEYLFYEPHSAPTDIPLWFVRDLMILCLLSPLIQVLVRRLRWVVAGVLGLCYVGGVWFGYCPGFSITGVFFFTLGASFAIMRVNPLDAIWRKGNGLMPTVILGTLFACGVALQLIFSEWQYVARIYGLTIVIGVAFFLSLCGRLSSRGFILPPVLVKSTFFVYALHLIIAQAFIKGIPALFHLKALHTGFGASAAWIAAYFVTFISLTAFCAGVYILCRRIMPRLTSLLSGGR